ncbi:response regulator [uncultured Microscilla sp.]|uniref:response regulator n=1 Tax=uncultured Microscilla sp. TaxID=432653 RepID=UPI002626FC62|nr:response regulator [uncultured Microscilla sp.]
MAQYSAELTSKLLEEEEFYLMVIDDDDINCMIINELLKNWSLHTVFVNSAEEAIEKISQAPQSIDLVLMDIHLPNINGIEATQLLRQQYALTVPIIALTADAMKGTRTSMMEAGMDDVLLKPLKPTTFHQTIGYYIQQRLNDRKINTN